MSTSFNPRPSDSPSGKSATKGLLFIKGDTVTGFVPTGFPDLPVSGFIKYRLAEIVPKNPVLRLIFRILDYFAPSQGRLYNWLRSWKCKWILKSRYPISAKNRVFNSREEALDAEFESLIQFFTSHELVGNYRSIVSQAQSR